MHKEIEPLAHEFELLAIKLRNLTGSKKDKWDPKHEFRADTIIPLWAGSLLVAYIEKTFKRWEDVKQRILAIDKDFFNIEVGAFYCPYIPLQMYNVNGQVVKFPVKS